MKMKNSLNDVNNYDLCFNTDYMSVEEIALNLKNIIVITLDGKYYLGEFDEKAGGECSTSLSKDITKIDFDKDDDE